MVSKFVIFNQGLNKLKIKYNLYYNLIKLNKNNILKKNHLKMNIYL